MSDQPKLLDRVRDEMRARHFSLRTEEAYVMWIKRFILHHNKRHPSSMGADEVNAFLTTLAVENHVSASTQNQALSALLFLYRCVLREPLPWINDLVRARRPERLPIVLAADEVRVILDHLSGSTHVVGLLLYGSGLRLLECLRLRVKDVDFSRRQIAVRDPKGKRDRATMLPTTALEPLRQQLDEARALHKDDLAAGFGRVWLPDAIARKYPNADREWCWQWVFPASSRWIDEKEGTERRHHLHESTMQRGLRSACRSRASPNG